MTGLSLAHYRIEAELGRGGMGIVYRAHDTKLDRTVALKVLPPHALASEDDRTRFQREARAAAKLHHAHIASVFEIGEAAIVPEGEDPEAASKTSNADVRPFIAMEFVDGESLAERIAKGPLKLDEAVRIASQIADALGAAHEAGIVHRDVKSGNVMLTAKGEVKVLDFGLAKTAASTQLTRQGATLGTIAYMSPEQARGEEVDGRTDLWALGVVLYEMIAGRLPFKADYEQAALYGILNEDPEPLTALRTGVPMGLEWIVSKLLAKPASNRYQTATDLLVDLRTVDLTNQSMTSRVSSATRVASVGSTTGSLPESLGRWSGGGRTRIAVIATAVTVAAAALAFMAGRVTTPERITGERSVKRLKIELGPGEQALAVAVTPDGSRIVYTSSDPDGVHAHVRDLGSGESHVIDGGDDATELSISSDGQWAYLTVRNTILKASLNGGRAQEILQTDEAFPQTAPGPPGTILYEDFTSIWLLDEASGERRQITVRDTLAHESDHDNPSMMHDGTTMMASIEMDGGKVAVGFWDLPSGKRLAVLEPGGYIARYLPTGYLQFLANWELLAVPFDVGSLTASGSPIRVETGVNRTLTSLSAGGTLVIGRQPATVNSAGGMGFLGRYLYVEPVLYGSFGSELGRTGLPASTYYRMDVHQATRMVVLEETDANGNQDIFVVPLLGTSRRQITFDGNSSMPVWNATGDSVVFVRTNSANPGGQRDQFVMTAADGTGQARILASSRDDSHGIDLSPDGRYLVRAGSQYGSSGSSRYLQLDDLADGSSRHLVDGARPMRDPVFSPDGRYVAFEQEGQVFAVPVSESGGMMSISDGPGTRPRWSPDGRWLAFQRDRIIYAVSIGLEPILHLNGGREQMDNLRTPAADYDLTRADVSGVIVLDWVGLPGQESGADSTRQVSTRNGTLDIILNWPEEVRRLAPVSR